VDNLNNIEQITLDNPAAGTYKIIVTGTTVPLNTQEFSVVYDYVAPELLLTYPMGGRNLIQAQLNIFVGIMKEKTKLSTLNFLMMVDLYCYSCQCSLLQETCGQSPADLFQMQKLELVQEVKLTFHNFSIMSEPKKFSNCCPAAVEHLIKWIGMQLQVKYEVLKLNGDKFDFVATTNDPTYTFTNLSVGMTIGLLFVRLIATGVVSESLEV
jgi:hypothetical protein